MFSPQEVVRGESYLLLRPDRVAMQDATAQVRSEEREVGREGGREGGRKECVLHYTQLCVLHYVIIFLHCVCYYTDGSASIYQQWTTKGQLVNFHQPLFIL